MPYGRSSAALDNISSILGDMQQRGVQRKAQETAAAQNQQQIRAQLLQELMRNPSAQNFELARSMGVQVPDFQMTPQQEAEAAIANRRKQSAGVALDPTQEQLLSMGVVQGGWAPQAVTDFTTARNNMDPAAFKAFENEGGTPANVVEKNKAATARDTATAAFTSGPRTRQADAAAANSMAGAKAKRASEAAPSPATPVTTDPPQPGEKPSPVVQMLLDYRYDPGLLRRMKAEEQQALAAEAQRFDPTFEMAQYDARKRLMSDFASGKAANNQRSLNTGVKHIESLAKAFDKLENRSFTPWNAVANYTAEKTGSGTTTAAGMSMNAVAGELAAIFKGAGATDQEIKAWREQINMNMSPEQQKAAIHTAVELLGGRLSALSGQYETGMGKPRDASILNPASRKILTKLGIDVDAIDPKRGGGSQPPSPGSVSAPGSVIRYDDKGNRIK